MTELPVDCTLKLPLFLSKTLPKGIYMRHILHC